MHIRFVPPELATATQANTLADTVNELAPEGVVAEICAAQFWRDSPLQLSLKADGCPPLHVCLQRHWLYSSTYTAEIRKTVKELFRRYAEAQC